MNSSSMPSPNRPHDPLDRRQVTGLWMFGAAILLVAGTFTPHLITVSGSVIGLPLETNIGIFGAERCGIGGCEPFSISGRITEPQIRATIYSMMVFFQVLAMASIAACATAGASAMTRRPTRRWWVLLPCGTLLIVLSVILAASSISCCSQLSAGQSQVEDLPLVHPGASILLMILGTVVALRVQLKRADPPPIIPSPASHFGSGTSPPPHPIAPTNEATPFGAPPESAPVHAVPVRTGGTVLAASTGPTTTCPHCGQSARWLSRDQRWFCPHEQRYL